MEPKIGIGTILCGFIAVCLAQEDLDKIITGLTFNVPSVTETTQFSSMTSKPTSAEMKGDGGCKCVEYYLCDPVTKTIIKNGSIHSHQPHVIQFAENQCDHYLDVCCNPGEDDDVYVPVSKPGPVSSATPPIPCGTRHKNGVGFHFPTTNDEVQFGELPWVVAILKKNYVPNSNDVRAQCGGSLIHPQVVMTGAHCVLRHEAVELKIRAGEWDTQTIKEFLPFQERDVKQIIVHPDFSKKILAYDVALLVLESPVLLDQHISTVCLPPKDQEFTQKNCIASGWGKTQFGNEGSYAVILKKVKLGIVDKQHCQTTLRTTRLGVRFILHHSFLCAGSEPGIDTCRGDGGGPLVCPGLNGQYQQAGIVAWSIGCGHSGIPGVYADVSQFRDWIDAQMLALRFGTKSYEE